MTVVNENENTADVPENYMEKLISEDIAGGVFSRGVCTRFPPEPNGYLHIGSAFAIHTNYALARKYGGSFHLRFDDTNPLKEDMEYVQAIIRDIEWLGCSPGEHVYYGSDYSEAICRSAETLILKGKAYVCDLTPDEMTAYRGTLTTPGKDSPYRSRLPEENLRLFREMRAGTYPNGAKVLRARIDMTSPNMNLRDPVLYRIIHAAHYRTGNAWCIYPMYDFAHPIQDAIEGITHSLCSMEFKDHRPLYEWVLKELDIPEASRQREFGRVNLTGVVTSKRHLRALVAGGFVDGWDDPRLPTLSGLRRRGFTPESIEAFVREIGMVRNTAMVDFSLLEHCLRQDLKAKVPAVMAVLNPLKVVLTNVEAGASPELLNIANNSEDAAMGSREVPFSGTLYIEREDFMEEPVKGFRRLVPGGEVRLKGAYIIRCDEVIKDAETGEVLELRCTYDPETRSGGALSGRKVKGTIHWVSAAHAIKSDVYLYEKLLTDNGEPKEGESWADYVNPDSVKHLKDCLLEPLADRPQPGDRYQFLRHGYFCTDSKLSTPEKPVFNRIVPLKDSWKGKSAT